MSSLTIGSLFAGIGGLELGLEMTGRFKTTWQVENNDYAIQVLEKHWPGVRRWRDVTTFLSNATEISEGWQVDLICGGFPCQPVSCAGKRKGKSDSRWLWPEFRRIVSILRPRFVLAENVPGLYGQGLSDIIFDLASLGYDAEWHCIPAAAFGAPHIRDRVFILGHAPRLQSGDTAGKVRMGRSGVLSPARRTKENNRTTRSDKAERWWATEPDVGRVADGVPKRVDRLRCLGNAVVPQVAQFIGQRILERAKRSKANGS